MPGFWTSRNAVRRKRVARPPAFEAKLEFSGPAILIVLTNNTESLEGRSCLEALHLLRKVTQRLTYLRTLDAGSGTYHNLNQLELVAETLKVISIFVRTLTLAYPRVLAPGIASRVVFLMNLDPAIGRTNRTVRL